MKKLRKQVRTTFCNEKVGRYRNWKGGVKRKGTRLWEKVNVTKILYLARVNVTEPNGVLNIGFLYHLSFPITSSSLAFYTTIASNSYIPPTFPLENVFLYLYIYTCHNMVSHGSVHVVL